MPCSYCGCEKVAAKGLCVRCYYRKRNSGTVEYKYKGKSPKLCSMEGCEKIVHAKGLCGAHWMTLYRHGDVVSPFGYGDRQKHPLYQKWCGQLKCYQGRSSVWDDFWQFVEDVGEMPENNIGIRRIDSQLPWGPDNFFWPSPKMVAKNPAQYRMEWRKNNIDITKGHDLRKHRLTFSEYMDMYHEQNGKCYICGRKGEPFSSKEKSSNTLAVDHCHKVGQVRKLLCRYCNWGLGNFFDNPESLRKAADYLDEHKNFDETGWSKEYTDSEVSVN